MLKHKYASVIMNIKHDSIQVSMGFHDFMILAAVETDINLYIVYAFHENTAILNFKMAVVTCQISSGTDPKKSTPVPSFMI